MVNGLFPVTYICRYLSNSGKIQFENTNSELHCIAGFQNVHTTKYVVVEGKNKNEE